MIGAIVLAAGTSSRMGEANKLLLDFRGKPLVRHTVEQLLRSSVDEIWLVTGFEGKKVAKAVEGMAVKIIHNPRFESGMSSSVKAGVAALPHEIEAFMICLSDMPLLEPEEYDWLIGKYRESLKTGLRPIVLPASGEGPGNPVIFHASYREEVMMMEDGPYGCKPVVRRNEENRRSFLPPSDHFFLDMDRPEDYQRIREMGKTL
jgi:molybdenum cofactor cytidylyltransferase